MMARWPSLAEPHGVTANVSTHTSASALAPDPACCCRSPSCARSNRSLGQNGPVANQVFRRVDRIIHRTVAAGVLARRWDLDSISIALNDSAWTVVRALDIPTTPEALARLVANAMGVTIGEVGDLRPLLADLVAVGLVEMKTE